MSRPILEVIALNAEEAVAACAGGADRLELVTGMAADGLTPSREIFAEIRAAVDLPLRVMLRAADGFLAGDVRKLCASAVALRAEGADEFVFGFLDAHGRPDLVALEILVAEIEGCRWTFHRAIDHAVGRDMLRKHIAELPGLDTYLTAGSPSGVDDGLPTLCAEAVLKSEGHPGYEPQILVGGGLRLGHVPTLCAAGIDAFHVGSAARPGGWSTPVDAGLVRAWRETLRTHAA